MVVVVAAAMAAAVVDLESCVVVVVTGNVGGGAAVDNTYPDILLTNITIDLLVAHSPGVNIPCNHIIG